MGKEPFSFKASEHKPAVVLSSCGVASDATEKNELIVENSVILRRLTLSESVMWYGLMFDALTYDECVARYRRSESNLKESLDSPDQVIQSLLANELVCVGIEPDYDDALFSMFCAGFLSCAVEQNDCGEFFRRKGHWNMYYARYLHWDKAEHSPVRKQPLTDNEHRVMAMLISESWSMAELVRNFAKGYDTSMTRFRLPEEKYGIIPLDPYEDIVRVNYERHPMAPSVVRAVLNLLRSRLVMLY